MEALAAQLAREQEANRILAARLQQARAAALPPSRLAQLVAHEQEALAWRRVVLGALRSGRGLADALRGEALLQDLLQGEGGAAGAHARTDSLWAFLAASDVASLCAAAAAPPAPLAPPPCVSEAVPLMDCFLVCGASNAALLGLWRSEAPFLRRLHEAPPQQQQHQHQPPSGAVSLPMEAFLRGCSASDSARPPTATLPPEVLFSFPAHAALPAEPSALAAFCLPEGAAVCGVPVPSLAARLRGSGSGLAWGRSALDCLFERAPGQNKGPRSHTFFLSGGLEDAPLSAAGIAAAGVGAATEARTRYCLCLAVSATHTLDMVWGLAATPEHPKPLELGSSSGSGGAPYYALSAPTVFCLVSRFPFFPAHLYLLRALAAQWRAGMEARVRALASAGHCEDLLGRSSSSSSSSAGQVQGCFAAAAAAGGLEEGGAAAAEASEAVREMEAEDAAEPQMVHVAQQRRDGEAQPPARRPSFFKQLWQKGFGSASSASASSGSSASTASGDPQQPSFWANFELSSGGGAESGAGTAAAMRRLSAVEEAPLAHQRRNSQTLGEATLAAPARSLSAPAPFLTEDEVAFLSARLSRHTFPDPLPATLAAYCSLPPPPFGGTLTWRAGLHPLTFYREVHDSNSTSSTSTSSSSAVGLRHAEARAALIAWALPVLASLLPPDSLLLLLGAALTEHRIIFVGGSLSLEALTAATAALPLLLAPLHWEGLHLPVLPTALLDVLAAPLPFIVGLRTLPLDFVQDEETIVVLLDCETLRIPVTHIPSGVFGGGPGDRSGGGGGGGGDTEPTLSGQAAQPSFLSMLIPEASRLFHRLEPLAAQLSGFSAEGGAAAAAAVAGAAAAAPQQQREQRSRRPCYAPTPQQAAATLSIAACIQTHVAGLLDRAEAACKGGAAATPAAAAPTAATHAAAVATEEAFPEAERPFWARFMGAQMFCCALDAKQGREAAAELRAAALRAEATLRLYGGGVAGREGAAGAAGSPLPLPHPHPQRAPHLPAAVPPPVGGRGLGGGGRGEGWGEGGSGSSSGGGGSAGTPQRRRAVGGAWRSAAAAVAPQQRVLVAVRSSCGSGEKTK